MNPRILGSTTKRILSQLRHDRRTIALLVVVPVVLLTLLYFMYQDTPNAFSRIGLIMLGVFPFVIMFLITSIAMLRERTTGTLERIQAAIAGGVAYLFLGLTTQGSVGLVIVIAIANSVLGVALGLFCSAFARTEFQAVQFMPIVVVPQILLCGLFVDRSLMAGWLHAISNVLPMTYAVEALQQVGAHAEPTDTLWTDLGIVVGCVVLALTLAAATLRRRTP